MTSASAPAAPPRRLPPSVLLLVGATLAFALGRTTAALVAVAAAVVGQQLAWLFPAPARRLALAVDAAIHRVSAFIGTAAFTVVHVVVVVPAWGDVRRNSPAAVVEEADGRDAALVAVEVGRGRVVGHFDRNTFFNDGGAGTSLSRFDNARLARSIFGWLAGR